MSRSSLVSLITLAGLLCPVAAHAGVRTVDLSRYQSKKSEHHPQVAFEALDGIAQDAPAPTAEAMRGSVASGSPAATDVLDNPSGPSLQVENIPGNEYPRKHTLYMNFVGEDLKVGADNSAENRSTLAKQGPYPAFTGGEQTAIAAAQEMAADVSQFGINVVYNPADRPPNILPYTMAMIGGSWQDTNIGDPAGGVAPGTDCGALGQRHVVYVFATGGWGPIGIANVTAQEAGHAWGLDHSFNCGSVMSYCGSGDGVFSGSCDGVCEEACQGSAGCMARHEQFCGEGSGQQNEVAELDSIFGGNEPDVEAPYVEIVSPADGAMLNEGDDVDLRAIVDDNYGGYGWAFLITKDEEVLFDEVDYEREVDNEFRAALNLVNLEPGNYQITVTIMDQSQQSAQQSVSFTVADDPSIGDDDDDDDGGDETGAADGGDGGDGGGPGDGGDGADGADGDDDDDDDETGDGTGVTVGGMDDGVAPRGCECTAGRSAPLTAWSVFGLLGLLGLRRRR